MRVRQYSGRTKKKAVGGRQRGAESAETLTPCITWRSTTAVGGNPPAPVIRALKLEMFQTAKMTFKAIGNGFYRPHAISY